MQPLNNAMKSKHDLSLTKFNYRQKHHSG